jgi:GNAT superfamily N-acetyltransferase
LRDWPAVARVLCRADPGATPRDVSYHLRHRTGWTRVAWLHGRVVGFYTLLPGHEPGSPVRPGVAWLEMVAVDPAVRGRGVDDRLLADCERRAADSGCHRLETACDPGDTAVIRLNQRRGYVRVVRPGARRTYACPLRPEGPVCHRPGAVVQALSLARSKLLYRLVYRALVGEAAGRAPP